MPSTTIGTILVDFRTNLVPFMKGMKRFQGVADKGLSKVASLGKAAFGAITVAAAGATAAIAKSTAEIRELAIASERLGMSAESLQAWQYAAAGVGLAAEDLQSGFDDFAERLSEATEGTGEGAEALERLGLSAQALNRMNLDDAAKAVADAMSGVKENSDRARLSIQLFGGEVGKKVAPLLAKGAADIERMADEAERLGFVLSDEEVQQVNEMATAAKSVFRIFKAMGDQLAVNVAPLVTDVANRIMDWWKEGENAADTVENIGKGVKAVWVAGNNVVEAFKAALIAAKVVGSAIRVGILDSLDMSTKSIRGLIGFFGKIGDVLKAVKDVWTATLENPIGAVKLAFISFAKFVTGKFRDMMRPFVSMAEDLGISEAFEGAWKNVNRVNSALRQTKWELEQQNEGVADSFSQLGAVISDAMTVDDSLSREAAAAKENLENLTIELGNQAGVWMNSTHAAEQHFEAINVKAHERAQAENARRQEEVQAEEEMLQAKLSNLDIFTQAYREAGQDRAKFARMHWTAQTQTALGALESITAGVAQNSKTMFRINKAAAIANAIVNGAVGVSKTLGAYPFPLSVTLAGLQAAAAAVQVATIAGTSYGGGGSVKAPSGGGGSAAAAASVQSIPDTGVGGSSAVGGGGMESAPAQRVVFETVPTPNGEAVMVESMQSAFRFMKENNIPIADVQVED